jgi:methylated-DNA-protein-cysteine methyltransferase-like protein
MPMTNFNARVYALVRQIPPGRLMTYSGVAAALGVPRGARAVGWALAMLPIGTDVPWQRVVNARGEVSERANHLNADLQVDLLVAEGVRFAPDAPRRILAFRRLLWEPPLTALVDQDNKG